MKILIITDEFYPYHLGGAGVVAQQIYEESLSQGYECDVLCSNPKFRILRKIYNAVWPFFYLKLILKTALNRYDKIIVNDLRSAYILSLLGLKHIIQKSVYVIHGTEVDIVFNNCSNKNKFIKLPRYYSCFLKQVPKVVFVSDYVKNRNLTALKKEGIFLNKYVVKYAGLSSALLLSARKKVNSLVNYNFSDERELIRIVSFSRIEKRKGYLEMLNIFKEIDEKMSFVRWDIFGEGSFKAELDELISSSGLRKIITLHEKIDRKMIFETINPSYYDVFWLLPNEPEAFGLTYLESSAVGVPVIGPNKYGIKEAINQNVNGFFYDDVNAMLDSLLYIKNNKYKLMNSSAEWAISFSSKDFFSELIN
ncbi:glycosyltransferase family 4 protein [Erwinia persicina]|uniref:glycosyltransferase family 4 protein n=1 Tax=Erwinia persicina TaxID=55211 RepID=UPI001786D433|nr:glycosyltransferase family 4 protein [Erwinia persicina]MBD8167374.1 glycosyltransferase family 4 protein [Erwinia persicina]QZQ51621.1 glycosyltransferase family 4 protein [Erwinia persicina]